ncbi:MAG: hypothetical protein QGG42_10455 [Phycisphaerae bacterium]|jgi:hypothetical protein|nr:hypothetical protein [Phycisphaerae bacterium]
MKAILSAILLVVFTGCGEAADTRTDRKPDAEPESKPAPRPAKVVLKTERTIHVFVALCDNDSQGIAPVSKLLGDGDDPRNNLYWGAMYGTKTFLRRSSAWDVVLATKNISSSVLERIILKHRATGAYLVADAYRGVKIKETVEAFLDAAAGNKPVVLEVGGVRLGICGGANLVAYVGHNGLMDFQVRLPRRTEPAGVGKAAIVLACKSKPYFRNTLTQLGCKPILLTTGLMAPEAYSLEAAVSAWLSGHGAQGMRARAALAYNKYQKCGIGGATRLFHAE